MSLRQTFLDRKLWKEKALSAQTSGAQFIHASFLRPVHADKVGILYSRNLESLKAINKTMSQQIRGVLSQGLIDGKHPRELARMIVDRVDKVGIRRARVLARTEMVNAHAEATLNSFEEAGVTSVRSEAEFTTAGDDRVCDLCAPMSRQVFSLEDARGVIPVHPNCRCAWLPVQTVIPPAQVPHKPSEITKPIPKVVKPGGKPVLPKSRIRRPKLKPKPEPSQTKPLTEEEYKYHYNTSGESRAAKRAEHIKKKGYVDEYTDEGSENYTLDGYKELNESYALGKELTPEQIIMDNAIQKNAVNFKGKDTPVLFRGLTNLDSEEARNTYKVREWIEAKPGEVKTLEGPTSFSIDGRTSAIFADGSFRNKDNLMIELHTPNGARATITNKSEMEFILVPDQKVRIIKNEKNKVVRHGEDAYDEKYFRNYIVAEII